MLLASLLFYTWGEGYYVLLMLISIALNYCVGIGLEHAPTRLIRKRILLLGVAANLVGLGFFKYTNWLLTTIADLLGRDGLLILETPIHLPIGISFFTFQAISYIVDVYRNETPAQNNPFRLGLYISSFPQLIAGPIVRYNQVAEQIGRRGHSFTLFASGAERFITGLGKKVLIANPLALVADSIFSQQPETLSPELAWLGILCYSLQIYFDFSGYSDMAVGLGRIFGFHFPENFNYPYIARSVQDFWRRWHISLSSWFRDYLYIPLGGNKKGNLRTHINLFTVFILCGLWHGASWNFLIWGLIHGLFLVLERKMLRDFIRRMPVFIARLYTLLVVSHAWVFFRAEDLSYAGDYLKAMYFLNDRADYAFNLKAYWGINPLFCLSLGLGVLFATPVAKWCREAFHPKLSGSSFLPALEITRAISYLAILYVCISFLAVNAYNPFIYFRF